MGSAVSESPAARMFDVRHVQLARALFAAVAAVMITFSPDHSAAVGLSVFSGFAIATALVLGLSAWLVHPAGERAVPVLLAVLYAVSGMIGGLIVLRSTTLFFTLVIAWALVAGIVEFLGGLVARRRLRSRSAAFAADRGVDAQSEARVQARDAMTVGIITVVLGIALLLVNPTYALDYSIADEGLSFVLTGITIGVGVFGGYAAIVAVYLAIAGFSPRRSVDSAAAAASSAPSTSAPSASAPEGVS
jgi:hypothetical protein